MKCIKLTHQLYSLVFINCRADLASTSTETSPDRELFETIEKVLLKENITGPAVNADATEVDGVDDKFKRLNLFFEKEKVCCG